MLEEMGARLSKVVSSDKFQEAAKRRLKVIVFFLALYLAPPAAIAFLASHFKKLYDRLVFAALCVLSTFTYTMGVSHLLGQLWGISLAESLSFPDPVRAALLEVSVFLVVFLGLELLRLSQRGGIKGEPLAFSLPMWVIVVLGVSLSTVLGSGQPTPHSEFIGLLQSLSDATETEKQEFNERVGHLLQQAER